MTSEEVRVSVRGAPSLGSPDSKAAVRVTALKLTTCLASAAGPGLIIELPVAWFRSIPPPDLVKAVMTQEGSSWKVEISPDNGKGLYSGPEAYAVTKAAQGRAQTPRSLGADINRESSA